MKLNLGTYKEYLDGWVNIDLYAQADVKADCFYKPFPFKDSSFDYIYLSHVLEHTEKPVDLVRELHRIGKPGCIVEIVVPHFHATAAILYHPRLFGCNAFTDDWFNQSSGWKGAPNPFKSVSIRWELFVGHGWWGKLINDLFSINPVLLEKLICLPGQVRAKLRVVK